MPNKIPYSEILAAFVRNECELLTLEEDYGGAKSKLKWRCKCGKDQESALGQKRKALTDFSKDIIRCRSCGAKKGNEKVITYQDFCDMLAQEGYKVLSPVAKKPPIKWMEEYEDKLIDFVLEGKDVGEISEILSRTKNSVMKKIDHLGLVQDFLDDIKDCNYEGDLSPSLTDKHGKKWSESDHEKLRELILAGVNSLTVAKFFGRTEYSVRCKILLLGMLKI